MEESPALSNLENETLIENHSMNPNGITSSPSGRYCLIYYLAIRLSPLFLYFFSVFIFTSIPTFKILVITLSVFCEFWLTKNKEGLELVGLRWSHEISEAGKEPKWVFYARPDPYVPDTSKLRCFWTAMYAISIVWSIISLLSLLTHDFKWSDTFLAFIATGCEYINLFCFLQCNKQSSKQADGIARTVMLGDAFDSDNLEPEPEPDQEQDPEIQNINSPSIIHTEVPIEKKRRELENPRLTLPIRTNKSSNPTNENNPSDTDNISQINDEVNIVSNNEVSISSQEGTEDKLDKHSENE